jgi:hypothetical protein
LEKEEITPPFSLSADTNLDPKLRIVFQSTRSAIGERTSSQSGMVTMQLTNSISNSQIIIIQKSDVVERSGII